MKSSHYITPRTSAQCVWIPSDDPIERVPRDYSPLWWIFVGILTVAAITVLVLT